MEPLSVGQLYMQHAQHCVANNLINALSHVNPNDSINEQLVILARELGEPVPQILDVGNFLFDYAVKKLTLAESNAAAMEATLHKLEAAPPLGSIVCAAHNVPAEAADITVPAEAADITVPAEAADITVPAEAADNTKPAEAADITVPATAALIAISMPPPSLIQKWCQNIQKMQGLTVNQKWGILSIRVGTYIDHLTVDTAHIDAIFQYIATRSVYQPKGPPAPLRKMYEYILYISRDGTREKRKKSASAAYLSFSADERARLDTVIPIMRGLTRDERNKLMSENRDAYLNDEFYIRCLEQYFIAHGEPTAEITTQAAKITMHLAPLPPVNNAEPPARRKCTHELDN